MGILRLFKKHYIASILLVMSMGMLIYAGGDLYKNKEQKNSPPIPEVDNAITLEPANQIALLENKNKEEGIQIKNKKIEIEILKNSTPVITPEIKIATSTTLTPEQQTAPANTSQITIVIEGKKYSIPIESEQSVYDAMRTLHSTGQVDIKFKNYSGLGHFVDGINGVNSDTFRTKYWIYYINDTKAQIGISQYTLKSKDIITWKYESAE